MNSAGTVKRVVHGHDKAKLRFGRRDVLRGSADRRVGQSGSRRLCRRLRQIRRRRLGQGGFRAQAQARREVRAVRRDGRVGQGSRRAEEGEAQIRLLRRAAGIGRTRVRESGLSADARNRRRSIRRRDLGNRDGLLRGGRHEACQGASAPENPLHRDEHGRRTHA